MGLRHGLMFFTLAGAGACAYFRGNEYLLSARSSAEPEEISLRDLIQRGPQGNPNIILKDFAVENYLHEKKLLSAKWPKVWVPVVPADEAEVAADQRSPIYVFLYGENVSGEQDARQRFDRPRFRGLVDSEARQPSILGTLLLNSHYRLTDRDKSMIIVEGKEPASVLKLGLYGFGLVLLVGLTAGIWYLARKLDKIELESQSAKKKQPGGKGPDEAQESIFI
jgi:hypothetical protein